MDNNLSDLYTETMEGLADTKLGVMRLHELILLMGAGEFLKAIYDRVDDSDWEIYAPQDRLDWDSFIARANEVRRDMAESRKVVLA